ncbi:HAD-IIA family hydrolase [Saccharomonospora xinjiangensis]|uniref:Putative sugar phosphatase of HAD superfamily n=1 Tax=Saccharomonospora xinjiangensis XJ-54 TaxID=882086 RepID=I0V6S0_9PSEU|nr:HAD-IIA family hydrolase [Saccharomonospora xinjiangensis]EID55823.1 putative sugar phosphatase of HAD superfamily [Saccharomonospora xinjiangensis XJ-54]
MAKTLLDRHDTVLFDLDGTVYHGSRPIPGAADAITHVRERGRAVRFVTNNAAKSPESVAEHLVSLGVHAEPTEVSTSAQAAAVVLRERLPADSVVLVVGTAFLEAQVRSVGLRPTRRHGPEVAAVVQGHSPDTCWADLAEACLAVRAGAWWVACNTDATLPSERGQLPGNGSMVAALLAATEREPHVAGKPEAPLLRTAAHSAGAASPLVVGDRLDTDIAGAAAAGFRSLAVLTGVATPRRLLAAGPGERPDYLAADLGALTRDLSAGELEIGPRPGWRVTVKGDVAVVESAVGEGDGDSLDLLRHLCHVAWSAPVSSVRAADVRAESALAPWELG